MIALGSAVKENFQMTVLYALPQAAELLGRISVWTLRKHISTSRLRVTRIGRRVFLDAEEIERVRREGLPSLRSQESLQLASAAKNGSAIQKGEPEHAY
jgi:hypothetical protein